MPSRFHERPVVPAVSRPPVVDPVLSRQHALRAHRPDREVARESGGAREVVDSSLPPGGARNPRHARAAQPRIAFQRGRNVGRIFAKPCEAFGEHRRILDRHSRALRGKWQHGVGGIAWQRDRALSRSGSAVY